MSYFDLIKKHWKIRSQYDIMIVTFPGHFIVPLAKIITRKKIIFDAFVSLYDTRILDREYYAYPGGKYIMTPYTKVIDWLACTLADTILLDTHQHIDYFIKEFGIPKSKFTRVLVGADNKTIPATPRTPSRRNFTVHFHGYYIPLQGIEYIIQAAKLLEKEAITFNIVGRGQTYTETVNLVKKLSLTNINFIGMVPFAELAQYMANADICLGIFGTNEKAGRVIPNKVYEALAARRAIITRRSDAVCEILTDRENVLLCNMGDARDLAEKILLLKNNPDLLNLIADEGYKFFMQNFTPQKVVRDLVQTINIYHQ
jgi:glycosyltransferase involved in cell wall biosynthesis